MTAQTEPSGPPYRLYTNAAISIGTAFGGPLAGGFLLSRNFRALGQPVEARRALWGGPILTLLFFALLFVLPERVLDAIPNALFSGLWGGIASAIVWSFQQDAIEAHLEAGGRKGSKWKVAGVSVVGLVATLLFVLPFALLDAPFDGQHVTLDATQAEVYYDGSATELEALALGRLLEKREYFSPGGDRSAQIERFEDGSYNVVLEIERVYWEQPALAHQMDQIIRDVEEIVGAPVQVTTRSYTLGPPEDRVFEKLQPPNTGT